MPPTIPPTTVAGPLAPNARIAEPGTDPCVNSAQRAALDDWKASQLAKAPAMDEATARRVSAALFGATAPAKAAPKASPRKPARYRASKRKRQDGEAA